MKRLDEFLRMAERKMSRRQAGVLGAGLLAALSGVQPASGRKQKRPTKRDNARRGNGGNARRWCGGLIGKPCPKGFTCVDDPGDDCDPTAGGADCIGICVRIEKDPCATVRCQKGTRCCPECGRACIPDDIPCSNDRCGGESCNQTTCGPGEYCCNRSCSRCVPLGSGCTKELCPPKDPGGEECGPNRCERGEYCCNPSCGVCAPLNGGCAAIYCDPEPDPEPEPGPIGERCGKVFCPRGQVCCNASCSMCTAPDMACIMIACEDEAID